MHMISLQAGKMYYWTKRKINQVKCLCVMLVTINNQNEIFFLKNPSIFTMKLDQIVSTQQDIISSTLKKIYWYFYPDV